MVAPWFFGSDHFGRCNVPAFEDGVTYTDAACGNKHTVLLQSNGRAVVFGNNDYGKRHKVSLEFRHAHRDL
jgi:alpha-tubulin suppressor-like RCC1 family protein